MKPKVLRFQNKTTFSFQIVRASSRLMSAKMSSVVVFFSLHVLLASGLKGEFMRLETGRTSSGGNDSTFAKERGHCLMIVNNA